MVNRLNGALRSARVAIDAVVGIDEQHLFALTKESHGQTTTQSVYLQPKQGSVTTDAMISSPDEVAELTSH